MLIEKIADMHWSAVFTPRVEKIRIISIRRGRKQEGEVYES